MLLKLGTLIFFILILRKLFRGFIIYEQLKAQKPSDTYSQPTSNSTHEDAIEAEFKVIK